MPALRAALFFVLRVDGNEVSVKGEELVVGAVVDEIAKVVRAEWATGAGVAEGNSRDHCVGR